jgi:tetratricopeptide (TPR) repeat protein
MLHDVIDALRRKTPDAMALARAEVETTPGSADAHHLLGLAQREAGDPAGARASFDRAIELAPDESLYHFSLALLAYAQREFALAERASGHALALDPNQLGAYILRIQLAAGRGDLDEAGRQLALAERLAPEHPQVHFAAGQLALARGDAERAVERLVLAVAARPDDTQVLGLLGTAYLRSGHPAFAEQALRKAVARDSRAVDARMQLVESMLAQGRPDDADAELAQWRAVHPHDPGVAVIAAELKLQTGDPHAALTAFSEALALAPDSPAALTGTERALVAIGDRALARKTWDGVLHAYPQHDLVWSLRLGAAGNREERDDVLRRWREAIPESTMAALTQALQDESEGRDADAEAGYDFVLARAPQQPDALFSKAMYEAPRDPDAALARLDALIAIVPKAKALAALAVRGQLHDARDNTRDAAADWLGAHVGSGFGPSDLPFPDEALQAMPQPPDAGPTESPVVLLWGPPGSGSERMAAALRHAPGRPLMLGTPDLLPRLLDFPDALIARATSEADVATLASEIAAEYARSIEPYAQQGNPGVFDWLGRWDARVVPALRHALPGLRLVAVVRDPRDLLLNWLAFGAPAGPAFTDPFACAAWLANQLEHLLFSRDALGLPVLLVDMDAFDAQPEATMAQVAAFADLASPPDTRVALDRRTGTGRLPTLLPAGRWSAYCEEFADAFELLASIAERLGYPREPAA